MEGGQWPPYSAVSLCAAKQLFPHEVRALISGSLEGQAWLMHQSPLQGESTGEPAESSARETSALWDNPYQFGSLLALLIPQVGAIKMT